MQILDADQYFLRSTVCTKQWVENVYILTVQINFIFPFFIVNVYKYYTEL